MTNNEWENFCNFKDEFKKKTEEWKILSKKLIPLIKNAAEFDTPPYPVENPLVYNTALDLIKKEDEIKLIVIGDNPGKNEQLSINQKYLIGQSGKLAEGFFKKNSCLEIDFRKNTIILNKTPVHTAKTNHLKKIIKNCDDDIKNLLIESQKWMAQKTSELHHNLENADLWLTGYAELKNNGIFNVYRDELKKSYFETPEKSKKWEKVFVFQHFSMNCFTRDLKALKEQKPGLDLSQTLALLGNLHKNEIF